jgi:uncharacterized protein DUF1176
MMFLAILLAAAAPQPGELKLFGDWTVGCDNGRACQAVALMPEDWPEDGVTMSVRRGPERDAHPAIGFPVEGAIAFLEADGRRLAVRLVPGESGPQVASGDVAVLLGALRSARRLKLVGRGGASLGTVSLAGAKAALLYMDERQRRVGTVTALARPGAKPASAVPAPPPLPVVHAVPLSSAPPVAPGAARIAALRKQHGCTIDEVGGPDDVEVAALGPDRSLVLLACGSGAYNVSFVPFIAERRGGRLDIRPAPFDLIPDWWEGGRPILINAGWDAASGLLTSFSKGRGLGDCGTGSDYAWDGARFRLVEQAEMEECRGSVDYITTWRARVVRP